MLGGNLFLGKPGYPTDPRSIAQLVMPETLNSFTLVEDLKGGKYVVGVFTNVFASARAIAPISILINEPLLLVRNARYHTSFS